MKQRYLAYRRHQGDTTDVFARKKPIEKALVGPSPFAELSNLNVLALAQIQSQQQAQQQPQATAGQATTGGNSTTTTGGLFGNTTSANTGGGLFGNSTATTGGLFGNARFVASFTSKQFFQNAFQANRQQQLAADCLAIRRRRNRPVPSHLAIRRRRRRLLHRYNLVIVSSYFSSHHKSFQTSQT